MTRCSTWLLRNWFRRCYIVFLLTLLCPYVLPFWWCRACATSTAYAQQGNTNEICSAAMRKREHHHILTPDQPLDASSPLLPRAPPPTMMSTPVVGRHSAAEVRATATTTVQINNNQPQQPTATTTTARQLQDSKSNSYSFNDNSNNDSGKIAATTATTSSSITCQYHDPYGLLQRRRVVYCVVSSFCSYCFIPRREQRNQQRMRGERSRMIQFP